ncbi:D-lactate dehydrogenase (cytochrome) [Microvirgula sp. AG722]|uniref:D-lactate dehydrogenase (cytochrome) n=1 Tax=Microvirgula aerodenitrificans TaxID=57480 RepID=A0A2S0PB57_9NEIS|nr:MULTISPECIES: FAD-linked oxidase C-terminal domain-containing protein [Microvirgula]AVY94572.1 2-hydroxy-acid oxidase [Microvirgula aerodenitrificans]RAS18987.1 D-lactate dehydrogenase (cytochrome) [Microvirgula sp. AG722]
MIPAAALAELSSLLGDRLSTTRSVCDQHGRDESPYPAMPPDAVAFADSTDEVARIVQVCARHRVPVIPYGAGSSIEGHLLAIRGGLSLDLSRMTRIIAIDADDLTATVEAGVTREALNDALRHSGLFFPIDPGANASLGGMSATRASGTNAVRYGTMRENVLALTVVTAAGKVIHTGTRARKSSAGYDLTRAFVGSEGTLGVMTEITVRLHPQPMAVSAAVATFDSVADAVNTVIRTIQYGIPVARVEFMDIQAVRAVNAYSKLSLREAPTLLFEFHGSEAGVAEQAETVQAIAHEFGGTDFEWASRQEDRSRLWAARHKAYFASLQLQPGSTCVTTDVCVPISRLAECVTATCADIDASGILATVLGHVGDGNFHVLLLVDPADPQSRERAEAVNARIVRRALDMDGTCTGEHGVGLHKMDFMRAEHGEDALDMMRALKRAFDPLNLMNPGKIVTLD